MGRHSASITTGLSMPKVLREPPWAEPTCTAPSPWRRWDKVISKGPSRPWSETPSPHSPPSSGNETSHRLRREGVSLQALRALPTLTRTGRSWGPVTTPSRLWRAPRRPPGGIGLPRCLRAQPGLQAAEIPALVPPHGLINKCCPAPKLHPEPCVTRSGAGARGPPFTLRGWGGDAECPQCRPLLRQRATLVLGEGTILSVTLGVTQRPWDQKCVWEHLEVSTRGSPSHEDPPTPGSPPGPQPPMHRPVTMGAGHAQPCSLGGRLGPVPSPCHPHAIPVPLVLVSPQVRL